MERGKLVCVCVGMGFVVAFFSSIPTCALLDLPCAAVTMN